MGGAEERDAEGAPVALEAVANRGEAPIGVEPLDQVAEYLFVGLVFEDSDDAVVVLALGGPDEVEDFSGEDCSGRVEAVFGKRNVAAREKRLLAYGFKCGFVMYQAYSMAT